MELAPEPSDDGVDLDDVDMGRSRADSRGRVVARPATENQHGLDRSGAQLVGDVVVAGLGKAGLGGKSR